MSEYFDRSSSNKDHLYINFNPEAEISNQKLPKITPKVRFPKPYLQNTKFTDLLMKNKNLLRRGQFGLPLPYQIVSQNQPKYIKMRKLRNKTEQIQFKQQSCYQSEQKSSQRRHYHILKSSSSVKKQGQKLYEYKKPKLRPFFKTLAIHQQQYQQAKKQPQTQNNIVTLRNSINRLVTAEVIKWQIMSPRKSKF